MNHNLKSKVYSTVLGSAGFGGTPVHTLYGKNAKIVGISLSNAAVASGTGVTAFTLSVKVGLIETIIGYGSLSTYLTTLTWWAGEGPSLHSTPVLAVGTPPANIINCFLPKGFPTQWVDDLFGTYELLLSISAPGFGAVTVFYTTDDVPVQGFQG